MEISTLGGWIFLRAEAKEYKAVRDSFFEKEGYVEWDEKALAYAIKENAFCNGKTLLLTKNEPDGAAKKAALMYRIEEHRLHIVEAAFEENVLQDILPELFAATGTSIAFEGNMGGMIYLPDRLNGRDCTDGYLALTLG